MELKVYHSMILNGNLSVFLMIGLFMDRLSATMTYRM